MAGSRTQSARRPVVRVLLDTNVLSEPLQEHPNRLVVEKLQDSRHQLHMASVVIHELASGVQHLSAERKQQGLAAYLVGLLESELQVLPYDCRAVLWHVQQHAQLKADGRLLPTSIAPRLQPRTNW